MKIAKSLLPLIFLVSSVTATVAAEDATDAARSVETLRIQLLEVQSKEADLEARAKQLEEDLKPDNIERVFAGIGSTKPEDLRELRRRRLTIERDSVRGQLKIVVRSRERLESVIRTAEGQAYQESAEVTPPLNQMLAAQSGSVALRRAMLILSIAAAVAAVALASARRAYILSKYSSPKKHLVSEDHRKYAR